MKAGFSSSLVLHAALLGFGSGFTSGAAEAGCGFICASSSGSDNFSAGESGGDSTVGQRSTAKYDASSARIDSIGGPKRQPSSA